MTVSLVNYNNNYFHKRDLYYNNKHLAKDNSLTSLPLQDVSSKQKTHIVI